MPTDPYLEVLGSLALIEAEPGPGCHTRLVRVIHDLQKDILSSLSLFSLALFLTELPQGWWFQN